MKEYSSRDIGFVAYLMFCGCVPSRYDNGFCFFEENGTDYEKKNIEYLNSDYPRFDSCIKLVRKNMIGSKKSVRDGNRY
jgi:hypothetical protein